MEISVVSPVYRAQALLPELASRLDQVLGAMGVAYEIVLVDDRSPDDSWVVLKELAEKRPSIKAHRLSRNFGQHYAITAGLGLAKGKWIVVMDCDLQDRPEEIPALYAKALEGPDAVVARRVQRQDKWSKRMSSKLYYSTFSYLTDTVQDPAVANFGIYDRKVVDAILTMKDAIRYFPTMLQWVGFDRVYLDVTHDARAEGESSYNWTSLFALAFNNILAFSDKPLRLTVRLGFYISAISMSIGVFYLVQYILGEIDVLGFASLIISISFFSGMIIMILGIIGLYLGKVFEKVKDRPNYIISETTERSS
ncbi:MAG: glycosyltransferase family 2 protein [Flavobacteriales bacterium]|nr:glycosyltransferase family 2 protein [Flavobacteriales bacterium]